MNNQINFPNIERLLNLHQVIDIIYAVDGYEAIFYRDENYDRLATGIGETVYLAMQSLDNQLREVDKL